MHNYYANLVTQWWKSDFKIVRPCVLSTKYNLRSCKFHFSLIVYTFVSVSGLSDWLRVKEMLRVGDFCTKCQGSMFT